LLTRSGLVVVSVVAVLQQNYIYRADHRFLFAVTSDKTRRSFSDADCDCTVLCHYSLCVRGWSSPWSKDHAIQS